MEGCFLAAVSSAPAAPGLPPESARMLPVGSDGLVTAPMPVFEPLREPMAADPSGLFVCLSFGAQGLVLCRADGALG